VSNVQRLRRGKSAYGAELVLLRGGDNVPSLRRIRRVAMSEADEYLKRGRREPTVDEHLTTVDRQRSRMSPRQREQAERYLRLMTGELGKMSYESRTEYLRTGKK